MGECHTPVFSYIVLHSPKIKAWEPVSHFHFAVLAMLETGKWKPEVRDTWEQTSGLQVFLSLHDILNPRTGLPMLRGSQKS